MKANRIEGALFILDVGNRVDPVLLHFPGDIGTGRGEARDSLAGGIEAVPYRIRHQPCQIQLYVKLPLQRCQVDACAGNGSQEGLRPRHIRS